jgi:hypothetical protein
METKIATTLEGISIEVVRALTAQATAAGLSLDDYLKRLLGISNSKPQSAMLNLAEFDAAMEEFGEDVPPLPRDFSREDIYFPE